MCFFLSLPWVSLQCVSVAFPGHILTYFFYHDEVLMCYAHKIKSGQVFSKISSPCIF